MEQPLVSIILPVYNAKDHLARCIESIRAQTWPNLELILINDGSSDNVSLPVCQMYARVDPRIMLVDKRNGGVSDARNHGIELAAGKYLQFVDSDDYLAPDYTANLVEKAEQTGADMVIAHYSMVIPRGGASALREKGMEAAERHSAAAARRHEEEQLAEPEVRVYGFLPEGLMNKAAFALHLMDRPAAFYYGVMWNKLYRRDIVLQHDIRCSTELPWSEDFLFNLNYIRWAENFYALAVPGYYYVQNPESICHTIGIDVGELLAVKRTLFGYYKQLYESLGLYEENRVMIHKYLVDVAENTQPTLPLVKTLSEGLDAVREALTEDPKPLAERRFDIVALGETLIDCTPEGKNDRGADRFSANPGGAPANVLAMCAKLGGRAAFIGMAGDDPFGHLLEHTMQDAGISTEGMRFSQEYHTTLAFVQLDEKGDRSFSFYRRGCADVMLSYADVDAALLEDCRIFHFGSVSLTDEPCATATLRAAHRARAAGAVVSYDPNYRPALWPDEDTAAAEMIKGVKLANVLKVSEEELRILSGTDDAEKGAALLAEMGPAAVLVTLGEHGACFYTPAGFGRLPAFAVKTVDTTGAGDAFMGSLLWQLRGKTRAQIEAMTKEEWEQAVRFSSAAGALTTEHIGAIPSMPQRAQIEEML